MNCYTAKCCVDLPRWNLSTINDSDVFIMKCYSNVIISNIIDVALTCILKSSKDVFKMNSTLVAYKILHSKKRMVQVQDQY